VIIYCIPLIATECSEPRAAILTVIPSKDSTLVGKGTMLGAPTWQKIDIMLKLASNRYSQPFLPALAALPITKSIHFYKSYNIIII
jgi:hypothetical protein